MDQVYIEASINSVKGIFLVYGLKLARWSTWGWDVCVEFCQVHIGFTSEPAVFLVCGATAGRSLGIHLGANLFAFLTFLSLRRVACFRSPIRILGVPTSPNLVSSSAGTIGQTGEFNLQCWKKENNQSRRSRTAGACQFSWVTGKMKTAKAGGLNMSRSARTCLWNRWV